MKHNFVFFNRQAGLLAILLAFSFFSINFVDAASCSIIPSVCISSSSGIGSINSSDYWGNLYKSVGTNLFGATCAGGTVVSGIYGNGTLVCSASAGGASSNSTYNATYALWAHNQTIPAINSLNNSYGKFWYNMTSAGSGGTYNETYSTWLPNYTAYVKYWYNMTSAGSGGTYNATYALWSYNQTYSGSTYNSSYANYAPLVYNHTIATNLSLVNNYGKWWYNMTYSGSTYNASYALYSYNQTYSGSTYNLTYATYAYNFTSIPITPAQTVNNNLSNVQAINFSLSSGYISSNSSCIKIINGGSELAICQ